MMYNYLDILVTSKNDEPVFLKHELMNEECADLTEKSDLFSSASAMQDVFTGICKGFYDEYELHIEKKERHILGLLCQTGIFKSLDSMKDSFSDPDDGDYYEDYIFGEIDEEYEDDDFYMELRELFIFELKLLNLEFSDIQSIILMTDNQMENLDREYKWVRYDLQSDSFTKGYGIGSADLSQVYYNPEKCSPSAREFIYSLAK